MLPCQSPATLTLPLSLSRSISSRLRLAKSVANHFPSKRRLLVIWRHFVLSCAATPTRKWVICQRSCTRRFKTSVISSSTNTTASEPSSSNSRTRTLLLWKPVYPPLRRSSLSFKRHLPTSESLKLRTTQAASVKKPSTRSSSVSQILRTP